MRKVVLILAVLCLLIPASALAKNPHRTAASFVPGTEVALDAEGNVTILTFAGNPYTLWGAKWCLNDDPATASFVGVIWGDNNDPAPTQGTVTFTNSGTDCESYVWVFPDAYTPVSDVVTGG